MTRRARKFRFNNRTGRLVVDNNEIVDSSGNIAVGSNILEHVARICDGGTVSTSNGDVTVQNVSAVQNLTTAYANMNGSVITYQPPADATTVIYKFHAQIGRVDAHPLHHARFYIGSTEITNARTTVAHYNAEWVQTYQWTIGIGGSTSASTGRQASWTSPLTLKWTVREYGGSNESKLHQTNWWDGSGTDVFHRPQIELIAIK